jgi:hypothetical protein
MTVTPQWTRSLFRYAVLAVVAICGLLSGLVLTSRSRRFLAPVLGEAISAAYWPHCRLMGSVVHMPKRLHSRSEALAKALGMIPCERIR